MLKLKVKSFINSLSSLLNLSLLLVKYNGSRSWVFNSVFGGGFSGFQWWVCWSVARWWVQWFWVDFCRIGLILVFVDFVVDFLGCAKLILWLLG